MNLITINNVRGYIGNNGIAFLNLEDVARGLGFTTVATSGNEVVRWQRVAGYLLDLGFLSDEGGGLPEYIPENIFYRLAMKAKNTTAEKFQEKVADEILPSIRKTGSYTVDKPKSQAQLLLAYAEHFVQMEQRQQQLENKIDTLTTGLTATPDHTKVVARVNELARWSRMGHNEVYNKIYDILKAKHGIDVRQRVENERHKINVERFNSTGKYYAESTLKSRVNGIDVMVRMGVLDKFNEILVGMLTRAKGA